MRRYSGYIKKYTGLYCIILLLAGIVSVCGLVKTYFLSIIIDDVLGLRNISLLKNIIIILIIILLLQLAVSYTVGYTNTYVSQKISFSVRETLIKKISCIYLRDIHKCMSGEFIVNVTEDVNHIANALCNYFVALLNAVFTVIITFLFVLYLNVHLALISSAVIIVQVAVSMYLSKITKKNQNDILKNNSVHISLIRRIVSQMKYIRAYQIEKKIAAEYNACSKEMVRLNFVSYLISYVYSGVNTLLSFAGSLIIFVLGVVYVYRGEISIGVLFVFDSLTGIISGNITSIVNLIISYAKSSVSFIRVNKIMDLGEEQTDGISFEKPIEEVSFQKVCFKYDEHDILSDFSCRMEQGNVYAIIGKSGMGKSTIFQLMLKFYNVDSGDIEINGQSINALSCKSLRDRIAIVFQDGCIIDGASIRENICFGNEVEDASFEEIVQACHISDFVDRLPQKYDTIIQENGVNFSGGEKQRIFVARALMRNADVYIFDEAFSQMDVSLENQVISYIREKLQNKIIIIVTHNIDVIRDIGTIFVFENNRTVSCGDNKSLLEESNLYQEFVRGETIF